MRIPGRGRFLHFTDEVCHCMRGPESDEQVNMVVDTANRFWHAVQSAHRSAQILVKAITP